MSFSYIWICCNLSLPLDFNTPDCHECKWPALLKHLNTTGSHLTKPLRPGEYKHLSPIPLPFSVLSLNSAFSSDRGPPTNTAFTHKLWFHTLHLHHRRFLANAVMLFRYHLISLRGVLCLSAYRNSYLIIPQLNQPASSAFTLQFKLVHTQEAEFRRLWSRRVQFGFRMWRLKWRALSVTGILNKKLYNRYDGSS